MAAIFLRRKSIARVSAKPLPLILCSSPYCNRRGLKGREGTVVREDLYETKQQDLAMTNDVGKEGSIRGVEAADLKDEGPLQAPREGIHELADDEEEKEGPNKLQRFLGEDGDRDLRSKAGVYDTKNDD